MINIAILGFGTIGSGVDEVISQNAALLKQRLGDELYVKYILDIKDLSSHPSANKVVRDITPILNDPEVSVVVEAMGGSHPAYDFSSAAIKAGKNVVTSNKEVVAAFGDSLLEQAANAGVRYLFEASVGGGIPIIRPLSTSLAGNEIESVYGILNGTTNYILTEMKNRGIGMEEALSEAQAKGYAEANPSADIDGIDACRKICILSSIAFGKVIPPESVKTTGIRNITKEDVATAEGQNRAIKLVARAVKCGDKIHMSVSPCSVSRDNPLYGVEGVFNGILVRGNAVGDLMFYGKGAGSLPTASAVLADIVDIAECLGNQPKQQMWKKSPEAYLPVLPDDKIFDEITEL